MFRHLLWKRNLKKLAHFQKMAFLFKVHFPTKIHSYKNAFTINRSSCHPLFPFFLFPFKDDKLIWQKEESRIFSEVITGRNARVKKKKKSYGPLKMLSSCQCPNEGLEDWIFKEKKKSFHPFFPSFFWKYFVYFFSSFSDKSLFFFHIEMGGFGLMSKF